MEKRIVCTRSEEGYVNSVPGLRRRTLVFGEKSLMIEVKLEKGRGLSPHTHPEEQAGYLISGQLTFTIGGEEYELHPGDSYCIPGGLEHSVLAGEDSVFAEVFSPVRVDLLP